MQIADAEVSMGTHHPTSIRRQQRQIEIACDVSK
jgi:hypothetical protein